MMKYFGMDKIDPFSWWGRCFTMVLAFYARIAVVVLGWFGRCPKGLRKFADGICFARNFIYRVRTVRRMSITVLKTGGHHPHLTQPKSVASTLQNWYSANLKTNENL